MARSLLLLASRESPRLLSKALQKVASLVPTGSRHEYLDKNLCQLLVARTESDDPAALATARAVVDYLQRFPMPKRIWRQEYEYADRERFLLWLHKVPATFLRRIREPLERCARSVAQNDPWEVQAFASLAGKIGAYDLESELLESARQSIEAEKMWEETATSLQMLEWAARANRAKQAGDWEQAERMRANVQRDEE
ncbi:MAG: hypothetical protein GY835_10115 [bacterium]|nr:hypothetical protein [bacterium]